MKLLLFLSEITIPLLIFCIVGYGLLNRQPVYEEFVEGAKDGFWTVIERPDDADAVEYGDLSHCCKEWSVVGTSCLKQWYYIVINQIFGKHGSLHICKYTDKDTYHNNYAGR